MLCTIPLAQLGACRMKKFQKKMLAGCDILVIANALETQESTPAFTMVAVILMSRVATIGIGKSLGKG